MRVKALSGSEYEAVERAILLNALPPAVRTVLVNSKAANKKQLAMEANQILEQHLLSNAHAGAVYELEDQASEEVHAVSGFRTGRSGNRTQSRQLPPPRPQQHQQGRGRLGQNHRRFGDRVYT